MSFKTQQEEFWAGDFGTDYVSRNQGPQLLASNLNFFARALRQAGRDGTADNLHYRFLLLKKPSIRGEGWAEDGP